MRTFRDVGLAVLTILVLWRAARVGVQLADVSAELSALDAAMHASVQVPRSPLIDQSSDLYVSATDAMPPHPDTLRRGDTLVLVLGGRSAKSASSLPIWDTVIGRVRWRTDQRVLVVTNGEDPTWAAPPHLTAGSGVPVQCVRMSDPRRFAEVTGVGQVPTALLFRQGQLVFMASGPTETGDVDRWVGRIEDGLAPGAGSPFHTDRLGDPVYAQRNK